MPESRVAKRYAQGLLGAAQDAGSTGMIYEEMGDVITAIRSSRELQNFFSSPVIQTNKKLEATGEIFKNFSPLTKNLVQLVVRHHREAQLEAIAQEFRHKVDAINGVQRVVLTSAVQLTEENVQKILSSTSLVSKDKKYEVRTIINPEILGGYILRVGDQQADASVRSKLENLKKEFQLN